MKGSILFFLPGFIFLFIGCKSSYSGSSTPVASLANEHAFVLEGISNDPTYGYTQKNPVLVGGAMKNQGPLNERRFLNALAGPNGEEISYRRLHSCCEFKTPNTPFGNMGLLDVYEITWLGLVEPIVVYINMYDYGPLYAPVEFTMKEWK